MNRYTYYDELKRLQECVETLQDIIIILEDNGCSFNEKIDLSVDQNCLQIASELIEKTFP